MGATVNRPAYRGDPMFIPIPEPGWHYRWLADDPDRLSLHLVGDGRSQGYSIVRGKTYDEAVAIAAAHGLPETYVDGASCRIRLGRLILGRIPTAVLMQRRAEREAERQGLFNAIREQYFERARSIGLKPLAFEDVREIEDRKAFATRESNNRVVVPADVDV